MYDQADAVIVQAETEAAIPLPEACTHLTGLLGGGRLDAAAAAAVADTHRQLIRAGVAGITKQVAVLALDPVQHVDHVLIPIRWLATGPGGDLFPSLDANITLHALAPSTTKITLVGSYRPPFGHAGAIIDRLVMRKVAEATLHAFLNRIIDQISTPTGTR
jgi:hypothetical protein